VLRWGSHALRVAPWQGQADIASVVPLPGAGAPPPSTVHRWREQLAQRGYKAVVTGAMARADAVAFLEGGFRVRERLHLLGRDLGELPEPPDDAARAVVLRRPRRADRDGILAADAASFGPDWRFDRVALADAVAATPVSRVRVVDGDDGDDGDGDGDGGVIVGYAISGRAGPLGYLQRLAVRPEARRRGLGAALVLDGLRWMRRRGARRALVNTQVGNDGALALYHHLGFRPEPDDLVVLTADLAPRT